MGRRALLVLGLTACGDNLVRGSDGGPDGDGATTHALYAPDSDDFYALPYPNDLRRHDDGSLDLARLPTNSPGADAYRVASESLDGFGLNSAMFARFDGPIDAASLPDAAFSRMAGAAVYVVNVDGDSAEYGARTPIVAHVRSDSTPTIGVNRLVVRPVPGFGLAEGTTYALVLTRRLRALDGSAVGATSAFSEVRAGGGSARERAVYAPLLAWLDQPNDDERSDVIDAAVFTTQHATQIAPALRKAVASYAAPSAYDVIAQTQSSRTLVTGHYDAPNFQRGDAPYTTTGGSIDIGTDGAAVVQRVEVMRFAMTVPLGPTPAAGWPLVIYAHGRGGSYLSFVNDGTAARLAAQGIAAVSTDQVLHGPRGGMDQFFNFTNPYASRDTLLQGAADSFFLCRLAVNMLITDDTSRVIKFDPTRVMFVGHDQGTATGAPFAAFEPMIKGAVFSGVAGNLDLLFLTKTSPEMWKPQISLWLRDDPLDEDSPILALVQMWLERTDPINYAPFLVRHPATADDGSPLAPRHVFQTEGFIDTFTPNITLEAWATALGGDQIAPTTSVVDGLLLRARTAIAPPFSGNVDGTTVALGQYVASGNADGHFVMQDDAAARTQWPAFLGTLAATGHATVVAP